MAIGAEPVKANPLAIRRDGHVADAVRRITCQTGNCPALEVQRAQAVERCLGVAHTHAESLLETRLFVRIDAIRSGEVDALCVRRKASETNTGLMPRAAPAGQFPPCRTGGRAVEGAHLESVRCGRESRHVLTAMCLYRRHARSRVFGLGDTTSGRAAIKLRATSSRLDTTSRPPVLPPAA